MTVTPAVFREMPIVRIVVELEAIDPLPLPSFAGSSFRGLLGHALKSAACLADRPCENCVRPRDCTYARLFETSSDEERGFEEAPRPFVLVPPVGGRTLSPGERFHLALSLLGRATDHIALFLFVLEEMAARGVGQTPARFRVLTAWALDALDRPLRIFRGGRDRGHLIVEPPVDDLSSLAYAHRPTAGPIELDFFTPARLVHRGRAVREPEFHVVVRALLRRLDLLLRVHWDGPLDVDFPGLIREAELVEIVGARTRWFEWERMSNRQQRKIRMSGFLGRMAYDASARPFLPLLRAGTALHVGKATTFGMGGYRLGPAQADD